MIWSTDMVPDMSKKGQNVCLYETEIIPELRC